LQFLDVLVVMGRWIYDSAHSGWNELHPVLHCQKIDRVPPADLAAGKAAASTGRFSNATHILPAMHHGDICGVHPSITLRSRPAAAGEAQLKQSMKYD
jgi:hypothetical protein